MVPWVGAANFAPFRNSARMKMIWDQRNSTPVIQHFSPKLLGLSYQLQCAHATRALRGGGGGQEGGRISFRVCVRARSRFQRAREGFLVKSEPRCFLPRRAEAHGICLKTKSRLYRET